ncbi:MAG TPA: outer membrane lipoprotein carrier protein LolA [Acidobacteriota bacterium]|nr:outer membrane lipoprotein carrier protein LolA [Acidobacteriota bacterium]HQM61798.1 outer membrane lipoprotein carrier protein LolA [Acidobacteriota bacterium]
MIRLTACLAIAWILSAGAAGADTFDRFLERFHGFRTLEARFSQSVQTPLGIEQASGRIWIRRPHLMRWDYQDPEPKIFLLRKNEYRMYIPAERQLVIQKLDGLDAEESPLVFILGGRRRLDEFFDHDPPAVDGARTAYVLRARAKDPVFARALLVLSGDPPFIEELTLYESSGSTHTYRFSEVRLDVPVPAGRFEFTPPADTEVLRPE